MDSDDQWLKPMIGWGGAVVVVYANSFILSDV
jgi:hypothetical protein